MHMGKRTDKTSDSIAVYIGIRIIMSICVYVYLYTFCECTIRHWRLFFLLHCVNCFYTKRGVNGTTCICDDI